MASNRDLCCLVNPKQHKLDAICTCMACGEGMCETCTDKYYLEGLGLFKRYDTSRGWFHFRCLPDMRETEDTLELVNGKGTY